MAKKIDLAEGLTHFKAKENASIAITEATSTASAPHKAGEYFYYKGALVIATADIAQGGTITLNTNCKKQPLADSVCELQTAITQINNAELNEVIYNFEKADVVVASGILNRGSDRITVPHRIKVEDVDFIDIIGNDVYAYFLLYNGDTYLGKLNTDGTYDKTSNNWAHFNGTINVKKVFAPISVDSFIIGINPQTTVTNYAAARTIGKNCCKFYSYKSPKPISRIEKIELDNGTWTGGTASAMNSFCLFRNLNRARVCNLIEFNAGDIVRVNLDNGKYYGGYMAWTDLPGADDCSVAITERQYREDMEFHFAKSGFMVCTFVLTSDPNAELKPSELTCSVTIERNSITPDVINQSDEQLKYVIGSQRDFTNTSSQNVPANNLATFVHVTDVHGDKACFESAYNVAKYINATALIATGDLVYYYSTDSTDYLADTVADKEIDFLVCLGNHDGFQLTAQGQNEKYIVPFASMYNYQLDTDVTYPTYYYKDYTDKALRVIVVNQFEYDGQTSTNDTRMNYTQAQVDFITDTLSSTPQNYGVIIAMHTPEKTPAKNSSYPKFFQEETLYSNTGNASMTILTELVDAFISKTTLSKTFNNLSGATPESVTVNADFSNVNTGVEFIAFLNGHFHKDSISYVSGTTNKQLLLNAVTTNSWNKLDRTGYYGGANNPYLTEVSDLQRIGGTVTQNAFNVYAIDRTNKTVRVTRIGADMPYDMDGTRDYMVIPYAD